MSDLIVITLCQAKQQGCNWYKRGEWVKQIGGRWMCRQCGLQQGGVNEEHSTLRNQVMESEVYLTGSRETACKVLRCRGKGREMEGREVGKSYHPQRQMDLSKERENCLHKLITKIQTLMNIRKQHNTKRPKKANHIIKG